MKPFTVVGYDIERGQTIVNLVYANDADHAIIVACNDYDQLELCDPVVFTGHHEAEN